MSHNTPCLPLELERSIFETAAVSRPMFIVDFMLVAWRVKNWQVTLHVLMILMTMAVGYRTEPLLYRVILLCRTQERQISGFPVLPPEIMRRIIADKPPKFLLDSVRHLLFDTTVERSEVQTILTACTHVANLFAYTVSNRRLGALAGLQHLRRLAINVYELLELCHKDPTSVRNLTHLELFNSSSASNYSYSDTDDRMGNVPDLCAYLAHMPHLTHIAFNSRLPHTTFYTALCANPGIVCIVALSLRSNTLENARALADDDIRFVCIRQERPFRVDWLWHWWWGRLLGPRGDLHRGETDGKGGSHTVQYF
ncbi:hypothetical protein B0H13DRAFT_938307 [Mycena leptocephala]|nr:hypothetical protein B0H13DRAFT_938307 [Mycena leptocephala]